MPIESTELKIKTFVLKYMCSCGGEMIATGKLLTSYPPLYEHQCSKCGIIENLNTSYPCLIMAEK